MFDGTADDLERTKAHIKTTEFALPVLWDGGSVLRERFGVRGAPTAYLIGADGRVAWEGTLPVWTRTDTQRTAMEAFEAVLRREVKLATLR